MTTKQTWPPSSGECLRNLFIVIRNRTCAAYNKKKNTLSTNASACEMCALCSCFVGARTKHFDPFELQTLMSNFFFFRLCRLWNPNTACRSRWAASCRATALRTQSLPDNYYTLMWLFQRPEPSAGKDAFFPACCSLMMWTFLNERTDMTPGGWVWVRVSAESWILNTVSCDKAIREGIWPP